MLATPIRRLRDTADLPQKLVNNEYIWLTGDRAVEGKIGDGERWGCGVQRWGGGEEDTQPLLDAQVVFAEAGRQGRRRVRFISHFHRSTCFNFGPLVDGLSLWNSWTRNCGLVPTR